MKHNELNLAEGFSFGKEGRYAVLKSLGRGWESEVYAIVDTDVEKGGNIKAAKFSLIVEDDHYVGPTWTGDQIKLKNKGKIFSEKVYQDLIWYEWSKKEEWRDRLKGVDAQVEIFKEKDVSANSLIPIIDDYGVTVIPYGGDLSVCLYQIMPFIPGKVLPDILSGLVSQYQYSEVAEKLLKSMVLGICDYHSKGLVIGNTPDDIDIHPENIMYDGEKFYLIDVCLSENAPNELMEKAIESIQRLTLYVLHWDMIGLSVVAHVQQKIWLEWLDKVKDLEKLPRKLSSECIAEVKEILVRTDEKLKDLFKNW